MKRLFVFFLLTVTATPLSAQLHRPLTLDELKEAYPELARKQPSLPHTYVISGKENPAAIPLHIPGLMMLDSEFGDELDERRPAIDRFAERYAADGALASRMVSAIREARAEIEAKTVAQRRAFCARNFTSDDSWKAAMIAGDAELAGEQVAAFNQLRDIAGPEVWEKIALDASQAARSITIVQEDYESIAAELGYETAFSNQCRTVGEVEQ